ncbi:MULTISPECIES: hypothetical protein [Streptosporangium]|uniref:hypothetical protein n=1 Tax=Streptosporangium TaxID=2000 RepID=UPI0001A38C51|nr:hypothetical protein [Streptosporangium roseum]
MARAAPVVALDDVLDGRAGRIVLTRADLIDAGIGVVAGSGGRLAPGSGPALDVLPADVNAPSAATCNSG